MKINTIPVGELRTNCYIIQSNQNNAMVIDAGADAKTILDFCEKEGLTIKQLVFTHGHFDHVGAMSKLLEKTDATTYIHELDEELMIDPKQSQSKFFTSFTGYEGRKADVCYQDGDVIALDDISLKVMHTPGHTKGSSVFICDEVIFTGDTVFAGGIGRTDLYGGDMSQILQSLKAIGEIEGDYMLFTGHGDSTRLSYEKATNIYMGSNYDNIF